MKRIFFILTACLIVIVVSSIIFVRVRNSGAKLQKKVHSTNDKTNNNSSIDENTNILRQDCKVLERWTLPIQTPTAKAAAAIVYKEVYCLLHLMWRVLSHPA